MVPNPVFSVVIPTRNGERYIAQAISSVLAQTYPHFRLFVLESGSADQTCEIVQSFDDPRVQLLTNPESLGIEDNWARILDLDLDEYLTILGHDDVLYPEFLEEIVRLIEREPEASLYHTHFEMIDANDRVIRYCPTVPDIETGEAFLDRVHTFGEAFVGTGYVTRSEDYRLLGGFPTLPKLLYADVLCWYQLAKQSYKVCSTKYLYAFRLHPHSTTLSVKHLPDFYRASQMYLKALVVDGYASSPKRKSAAHEFIKIAYKGHFRDVLFDLARSSDANRLGALKEGEAELFVVASEDPIMPVLSLSTRGYRLLARIPSYRLRRLLISTIRLFRPVNRALLKMRGWLTPLD